MGFARVLFNCACRNAVPVCQFRRVGAAGNAMEQNEMTKRYWEVRPVDCYRDRRFQRAEEAAHYLLTEVSPWAWPGEITNNVVTPACKYAPKTSVISHFPWPSAAQLFQLKMYASSQVSAHVSVYQSPMPRASNENALR